MYDEIIRPYTDRLASTGRKETTVSVNYYRLQSCLRTLEDAGRPTDPLALDEGDFQFLKERLVATRTNETTAKAMLKTLDNLVVFCGGSSVLHRAQILWNRPVVDRAFITVEEASRMYDAADPPLRLIIVLGSLMGLRREEMANIRMGDIRPDSIVVHGKGHGAKGLVVPQPMPDGVRREIAGYLPWRKAHAPPGSDRLLILLTPQRGRAVRQSKVLDEISARVKALGEGIGIRATTHSLRRLYATTVYEVTGHDTAVTKTLMRHASVMTTIDCYISPNTRAKRDAVEKLCQVLNF